MLSIQGSVRNIPVKDVDAIPANNMLAATSGYQITDNLYVTKSGYALMINTSVNVDGKYFAAKYDGREYHSDYLNATSLGKVSQINQLAVDEDGNLIYTDENGYVYRLEGSTFVYKGVRAGIANITGESAMAIIKNGFFLDALVDGAGNITGYRTGGGTALTQAEALQVFRLGGAGTFMDAEGNVYFFDGGQLLCRRTGVYNITGASAKQWLLDNAQYTMTREDGTVVVFDRTLTEKDALYLIYGVDDAHPNYTDANGNAYRLIGSSLVYQGAPAVLTITSADALSTLNGMIIGYRIGERYVVLDGDAALSGADAAYLLYTQETDSVSGKTYFKIDASTDRYVLDESGNLLYSSTPLPGGMSETYSGDTLPAGSTVLTSDGSGHPLTVSVGGYVYNVTFVVQKVDDKDVTVYTYTYSQKRTGVSDVTAASMTGSVTTSANRLYDASDITKYFAASITAAQALALVYPTTAGTYTDAGGVYLHADRREPCLQRRQDGRYFHHFRLGVENLPALRPGRLLLQRQVLHVSRNGGGSVDHTLRAQRRRVPKRRGHLPSAGNGPRVHRFRSGSGRRRYKRV